MAYPAEDVLQTWLDALSGLDIRVKKMFGCFCVYCSGQAVGWLSEMVFSLKEVGLTYLPESLERPLPGASIREIVIPLDLCRAPWLPQAVRDTAEAVATQKERNGGRSR